MQIYHFSRLHLSKGYVLLLMIVARNPSGHAEVCVLMICGVLHSAKLRHGFRSDLASSIYFRLAVVEDGLGMLTTLFVQIDAVTIVAS